MKHKDQAAPGFSTNSCQFHGHALRYHDVRSLFSDLHSAWSLQTGLATLGVESLYSRMKMGLAYHPRLQDCLHILRGIASFLVNCKGSYLRNANPGRRAFRLTSNRKEPDFAQRFDDRSMRSLRLLSKCFCGEQVDRPVDGDQWDTERMACENPASGLACFLDYRLTTHQIAWLLGAGCATGTKNWKAGHNGRNKQFRG